MVVGLENTGNEKAQSLAFDLARKWLNNNYEAYIQSIPNAMFEKVCTYSILTRPIAT
jgi:alpha,alpha-trehalase